MKIIEHTYGADLNWVAPFALQMEGKTDGNFIVIPDSIQTGTRYVLDCGDGIIAYYIDVTYNKNLHLIQKNNTNDFIGIYYNLTEGEASLRSSTFMHDIGRWKYNLTVIDGGLESNYFVKNGSKTYVLCIFVKKTTIATFAKKNNITFHNIDKIADPEKNTIIRLDRMSSESYHILTDLRKLKVGGPVFDLNLVGTVHLLLSNYLRKMASHRIIIQTVNESDLANIVATQMFLISNIEDHFPTIKLMASKANMSESKFKNLFKKITGATPNAFFMDNKMLLAKELLEKKQLSISQVSDKLNFTNNSYFASKFKEQFGITPKSFIKQL
ncbi:AraC family transcriptional regulator [Flavobacterium sp. PL02]|uniref:helix-turn-helix transcriptional regulator n=1 Tax=Flavobacterium sp. PL02 TaxID=3088354 RepID=UPI002B230A95|nr:AraC family transcriptional regulator [Flavobacterium sp. PL02]MEA9414774.1 AraC family transcriptional regulator [Flavobacterium sp. PL02]